ncbi:TolC family outer membrane protein [Litchfieldella rifensis]|uniref:TolC family outer membrane protein n=1 Tax=Litchfieldella rifensis TaxID=762643 RepID=A0ABV7LJC7_9GAMM
MHNFDSPGGRFVVQGRRAFLSLLISTMLVGQAQAADLWAITRDALENNAELAASRSRLDSVEAGRDVVGGGLLPQISASAEAAHNRTYDSQSTSLEGLDGSAPGGLEGLSSLFEEDDVFNSAGMGLEASQALYDAATSREVTQAEREIDQEAFNLAASEQQLLFDVANAYFEILRANDILAAREAQARAIKRQLAQVREQFEVGLVAITDVEEAVASFDQARADRIAAQSDLQVSFEALERLTGERYDSIESLGEDMPIEMPTPAERDAWVELALANSPVLKGAQAGVEVSRSAVEVARAARLPVLEAFASYDYADSDSETLSGYDSSSQVGLRANMPLYTGGTTSSQIRQNTYELEVSQYDAEAQRRDTIQQVRSLFTRVQNDVATVEARRQAVVSNRSALEATRSGYEVGTRNIVDLLNAEQNLYDAVAALAEARYDFVLDRLELFQQTGMLDAEDIQGLNARLNADEPVSLEFESGSDAYRDAMDIGEPPRR